MLCSLRRCSAAFLLAAVLGFAAPAAVGAQSAASPTPTPAVGQTAEIATLNRYAVALGLAAGVSLVSLALAGTIVRRIQRISPPDD